MRIACATTGAGALAALWLVAAAWPAAAKPDRLPVDPVAVELRAYPLKSFDPREPDKTRFGALEFLGGIELQSNDAIFGGLSAVRLDASGERLLAISDGGLWLSARLVLEGGKPARLAEARMAAILGEDGAPLTAKGEGDAESLAIDGGTCFVGVERANEIFRFDCARDPLSARGTPLPAPPAVKRLPFNRGLEALETVPAGKPLAGQLIGISERGSGSNPDPIGIVMRGTRPLVFRLSRTDDFDVTDAVVVGSALIVLERHFSASRGVAMRMRRVTLADIRAGATVDGEVLILADRAYQIDNMEGISAHRNAAGQTILTLVSDDNYSMLQRTLLLQFRLVE